MRITRENHNRENYSREKYSREKKMQRILHTVKTYGSYLMIGSLVLVQTLFLSACTAARQVDDANLMQISSTDSVDVQEEASLQETEPEDTAQTEVDETHYYFRNNKLLTQHYEKHGIEMGFDSAESYEEAANDVIHNPDALYKTEAEDGDGVYYVEATNEFVILSTDGYIRTYFLPSGGIDYFNRQ